MSKHLRLALTACCCIIVFLLLREPSCSNLRKPNKNTKQVSKESVFVFTAYLDKRQNSSFIRIPALNRCPKKSEKFLYVKIESRWVGLIPETIENGCPWTWAKGCSLVAHLHSAQVPDNFQGIDIEIKGPGGVQRMNLKEVLVEKEDGLTVCVPPIYWYTDWTKLILFTEYWRLQGATQFVFYYLSGTEDVRKVFDFYSKEDWMTILSWPLLPSNDMFDPNPMVYRVGHSIAHNDCLLRTKTSRAVLLDVDELIYSKNASFLAMVDTFLNKSSVGGVLFNHHVLQYDPPLNPKLFDTVFVDYLGVLNPKWTLVEGPKKVVFNPSTVKRLGVHAVNQYLSREWKTVTASDEIGMLLHNRYNSAEYVQNSTQTNFSLVSDPEEFRKVLLDRTREIFPDGASFNAGTQEVMAECLQDWRNGQGNCKNPIDGCRFQLQLLEKWNENTDDVYNVL